jgi:hypothetical protein
MSYDNAEDYLIRAQEAANSYDNDGRKEGIKQFIDDKTYKPGSAPTTSRSRAPEAEGARIWNIVESPLSQACVIPDLIRDPETQR